MCKAGEPCATFADRGSLILEIEVPGMHILVRSAESTTVSCAMSAARPWHRFWISENGEAPARVSLVCYAYMHSKNFRAAVRSVHLTFLDSEPC